MHHQQSQQMEKIYGSHNPHFAPTTNPKEQTAEQVWQQVRAVQNQTAVKAKEYRDIRSKQEQIAPSETAAERYQHRQVQKDFGKCHELADGLAKKCDTVVLKQAEEICIAFESGISVLAAEKASLEARLRSVESNISSLKQNFEKELAEITEKTRQVQEIAVTHTQI